MNLNTKRNLKLILASGSLAMIAAVGVACGSSAPASNEGDALKLGYLADYTSLLATLGPEIEKGVQLAVEQINAAGGVNGQDVTYVTADSELNATTASTNATRLIDVEGVHAIIGPLASGVTSAVSEGVIAGARIPHISPSASSVAITNLNDNGFTFRTTLSDLAQGIVLADNVLEADGAQNVGVLFVNNAYGLGLERVFSENFDGFDTYTAQSYEEDATTYLAELNSISSAVKGEALIIIGYNETVQIFEQAEQSDLFETYYFVDGNQSAPFPEEVYSSLQGLTGTTHGAVPGTSSRNAFDEAFRARFGADPVVFTRQAYDAAIAIALAAERAGSLDGAAIRDQLIGVGNAPGREVVATVASLRAGLEAAVNGNDVNYEGVASPVAWDENGDIPSGAVEIWEFQNGKPVALREIPVSLD